MIDYRLIRADETDAAARLHRIAGALIPGNDPTLEPADATFAAYRAAFGRGAIWGAFDGDTLVGIVALETGWIEHLYVEPSRNGKGIGRALVELAQAQQDDLQLYTWQTNARARQMYEAAGFVSEAFGIDPSSPVLAPNVRYRWRRRST